MKISINGTTGFVGGALARYFVEQGHEVHALIRSSTPRPSLPLIWHEGDITQPDSLAGWVAEADWVIHAAGMLGKAGTSEAVYQQVNVEGTRHVVAAVLETKRPIRFLHVSSAGVLGPLPDGKVGSEQDPLAPSNGYERSKATAEEVVLSALADGLNGVIVRPEFIYGPGDLHVLGLFRAVQKGHFFYIGDGRHVCHPTYIYDAVVGMVAALERGQTGASYLITGPRPVSFREFGETIAAALGVSPPWLRVPRPLAWAGALGLEVGLGLIGRTAPLSRTGVAFFSESRRFSWAKAQNELRYAPHYELAAGVAETVAWYRQEELLNS